MNDIRDKSGIAIQQNVGMFSVLTLSLFGMGLLLVILLGIGAGDVYEAARHWELRT